jgi:hypothetical protein
VDGPSSVVVGMLCGDGEFAATSILYFQFRLHCNTLTESYCSSVCIALGYRLDDRGSRVRLPAGAGNFSLHPHIQNSCGTHPASYPMGTRGSFPGGKGFGA